MVPEKQETQIKIFESANDLKTRKRQEMLRIPQVMDKMTQTELMICNASIQTCLKNMSEHDRIINIKKLGKGILRDIGFRDWDDDELNKYRFSRFMDILMKYFPTFTISDIKLAFELMAVGLLNDHLPKDKNGNPEKNHYQDFSVEYYSRILNAYKEYRSQIWFKAQSNVPRIEQTISEEQKKQNSNFIIEEIYKSFDDFKDKKIEPNFDMHIFIRVLVESELLEIKPIQEESINKAYKHLLTNNLIKGIEKKRMIDRFAERKMTRTLRMNAWTVQNNKTIKEYFEKLIEEKKDIRECLEKIK